MGLLNILGAIGHGISGATQAAASNRGTKISAHEMEQKLREEQNQNYQNNLINRSQDDRASSTDAMKKSQIGDYIMNQQHAYVPPTLSGVQTPLGLVGAKTLPNYGFGPYTPSSETTAAAGGMADTANSRLRNGSTLPVLNAPTPYTIDPKLLKMGLMEKIGNVVGPILGGMRDPKNDDEQGSGGGGIPAFDSRMGVPRF